MERKEYEVVIKLIANQKPCHSGHQIGDEWVFNYMTPPGMCGLAFNALYPIALALQYGATFPWEKDPDKTYGPNSCYPKMLCVFS